MGLFLIIPKHLSVHHGTEPRADSKWQQDTALVTKLRPKHNHNGNWCYTQRHQAARMYRTWLDLEEEKCLQGASLGNDGTLTPGQWRDEVKALIWVTNTLKDQEDSCLLRGIWSYGKPGHQQLWVNGGSALDTPCWKGTVLLLRETRIIMMTIPWQGGVGRQTTGKGLQECTAPQEYAEKLKIAWAATTPGEESCLYLSDVRGMSCLFLLSPTPGGVFLDFHCWVL